MAQRKNNDQSNSVDSYAADSNNPPLRSLHVAAAQVHSGNGVTDTLVRIDRQAAAASILGAQIILFSEAVMHGYDYAMTPQSIRSLAQPLSGPDTQHLSEIAQTHGLVVIAGMFEKDSDDSSDAVYNSMVIAWPDGSIQSAHKHVLTAAEQSAGLTPGPRDMTIIQVAGVRCAIVICADCSIENLHEDLKQRHADFRLCPTGGGGSMDDILCETDLQTPQGKAKYEQTRKHVYRPQAIFDENDCPYTGFASANALGPVGSTNFHQGHCMIVDNRRVLRAQIAGTTIREHAQDQLITARLNF